MRRARERLGIDDATPRADPPTELLRTLPREAYISPSHFEREAERIFRRGWFCVGREEAVSTPGAYLLVDVAGERALVVRTRTGDLHAFHNVCRHRGSELVIADPIDGVETPRAGRFRGSIRCPYHAWTYGLDGELRNAPFLTESDGLRREQLGLYPVAVDTWGGFVFVDLAVSEPISERSLEATMGAAIERSTNYPLAELRTGARRAYDVAANWKVIVENYNECYHCGPVHPELCEVVPAFKETGGRGLD
jgi:glycine betaine catabolism A